jgi:non-ribosomal peptide synthetase component F
VLGHTNGAHQTGWRSTAGVANVIAYEVGVLRNAGVRLGDKVLQWMAVNFDLSVLDFWSPIAMGCAVVVAPAEDMKNVERVAALVQQHYIASISIVPSMCQVSQPALTTVWN